MFSAIFGCPPTCWYLRAEENYNGIPEEEIPQYMDPSSDEIEELFDENGALIQWCFLSLLEILPLTFYCLEALDITTYLWIICSI